MDDIFVFAAAEECVGNSKHPWEDPGVARSVVWGGQMVGTPPGHHTWVCPAAALPLPSRPCARPGKVRTFSAPQSLTLICLNCSGQGQTGGGQVIRV